MNHNEKQQKEIYDFIMQYNSDEAFKKSNEELYNNDPIQIPILHIYALEEVLRFGTRGIYKRMLETKGTYTEEQSVDLFDGFIKLLNDDANFKQFKTGQFKGNPETLSAMEIFAFTLISKPETKKEDVHEETTEELEYDPLNPILFGYDKQIRETLENLFLGKFIHQMLELPTMKSVKDRQKQKGMIANVDKPLIIEKTQGVLFADWSMSQFKQVIDNMYAKVKMPLLMGGGAEVFAEYVEFNTNVSANEVLGLERDTFAEDMYESLKDMINKRKAESGSLTPEDAMDIMNRMREEGKGPKK